MAGTEGDEKAGGSDSAERAVGSVERFELVAGNSAKYWEIRVDGSSVTVTFGRIGTAGQSKTKTLASAPAAERHAAKMIADKTRKGYRKREPVAGGAETARAEQSTGAPTESEKAPPAERRRLAGREQEEELFEALRRRKLAEVTALLDAGVSVDATDEEGVSALHRAATIATGEITSLLVERGARIDTVSRNGTNVLAGACNSPRVWLVELCLNGGQRIDAVRPDGRHLYEFAFFGWHTGLRLSKSKRKVADHLACVELLTRSGHDLDVVFHVDRESKLKTTLLGVAVSSGNTLMVSRLLELGCDATAGEISALEIALRGVPSAKMWDALGRPTVDEATQLRALNALPKRRRSKLLTWLGEHLAADVDALAEAARRDEPTPDEQLARAVWDQSSVKKCKQLIEMGARADRRVILEGVDVAGSSGVTALKLAEKLHLTKHLRLFWEDVIERQGIAHRPSGEPPGFCGKTMSLVIAGTARDGVRIRHIEKYRDLVRRWAESSGLPLVAALCGNDIAEAVDKAEIVVGLEIARCTADEIGGLVPRAVMAQPQEAIAQLPEQFSAELQALDAELSLRARAGPGLLLVCAGPLARASLVYGVPGRRKTPRKRGQRLITGTSMRQEKHSVGVVGEEVALAQMESPRSRLLDPSHLAKFMDRDAGGEFYLIASYD